MQSAGDDSLTTLFVSLAAGLGFGLFIYFASKRTRARRIEAMTTVAARLRFRFRAEGSDELRNTLGDLPLFARGRNRELTNLFDQAEEFPRLAFFDYEFSIGGGRSQQQLSQTVACLELEHPGMPDFTLKPESLTDKIATKLGGQDIDFESRPDFSAKYRLTGSDESAIRHLFNERVLGPLERLDKCSMEAAGSHIIFYRYGRKPKPEEFEAFARLAQQTLGLFVTRD